MLKEMANSARFHIPGDFTRTATGSYDFAIGAKGNGKNPAGVCKGCPRGSPVLAHKRAVMSLLPVTAMFPGL
jgi:hypothetical protein